MRPFWTDVETLDLLEIFNEKNVMALFDGKRFRNNEIYKMVSSEMLKRGYVDRDEKQIEYRWKNLKRNFIAAKKNNNVSGAARSSCKYYEELNRILSNRPSTSCAANENGFEGVDVTRDKSPGPEPTTDAQINDEHLTAQPPAKKKKPERGSYAKCIDKLADQLIKTQNEISDNFLNKQKELVNYEFKLYKKFEEEQQLKHVQETNNLLQSSMNCFFEGIREILGGGIPSTVVTPTASSASSSFNIDQNNSTPSSSPPTCFQIPYSEDIVETHYSCTPSSSSSASPPTQPTSSQTASQEENQTIDRYIQIWNDDDLDYV